MYVFRKNCEAVSSTVADVHPFLVIEPEYFAIKCPCAIRFTGTMAALRRRCRVDRETMYMPVAVSCDWSGVNHSMYANGRSYCPSCGGSRNITRICASRRPYQSKTCISIATRVPRSVGLTCYPSQSTVFRLILDYQSRVKMCGCWWFPSFGRYWRNSLNTAGGGLSLT